MKLSIKDINFKELLLNHAEKVVFGLIAVIAVGILYATSWTGYDKKPIEFQEKVDRGEIALKNNDWTPELAKTFNNRKDVFDDAIKLIPNEDTKDDFIRKTIDEYVYSTDFDPSTRQQIEPIDEPVYLALESPTAKFGRGVIGTTEESTLLADAGTDTKPTDPKAATSETEKDKDDRFKIKTGGSKSPTDQGEGNPEGPMEPDGGMSPDGEDTTELVSTVNRGRGVRFIAVNMIFPLRKQYEAIALASHKKVEEIMYDVVFTDFKIQRMEAVPGPNPWSGKWKDVDIEAAYKILDQSPDFDSDGIDFHVKELFTMPLPMMLMGNWNRWSSHKRIKEYHLSPEALKRQKKMKGILRRFEERIKSQQKNTIELERKGFDSRNRNFRGLSDGLMQGQGEERTGIMDDMERRINRSVTGRKKRLGREDLEQQLSAAGSLLLFRYIDFEVQQGKVYRYRARLILKNPNYKKASELIKLPAIAEGLYRPTPWSPPTPPVAVPQDIDYYITNVITTPTKITHPTAHVDVFHWWSDSGTVVHKQLKIKTGEFLSRRATAYVLRPGTASFEEEQVTLGPDQDVLIDINNDNYIRPVSKDTVLSGLGLPANQKGIGAVDQILVIDQYGRLVPRNIMGDKPGYSKDKQLIDERDAYNAKLKGKKKKAEKDDKEGDLSEFFGMEEEQMQMEGQRGQRRANVGRIRPRGRK